jgi:hypothetical protein
MNTTTRTWLGHCIAPHDVGTDCAWNCKGQADKIDLCLLEGMTLAEIALTAQCEESRVLDHFAHLKEFWNGKMEPHHLKLKKVDGVWSFDV